MDPAELEISSLVLVSVFDEPPNLDEELASASTLAPKPNHEKPPPPFIDADTPASVAV